MGVWPCDGSGSMQERAVLFLRRSAGLLLNLSVLLCSLFAIVWITVNQGEKGKIKSLLRGTPAENYTELAGPIATSLIGALMPIVTFYITAFENVCLLFHDDGDNDNDDNIS